jgi:hypothetical protein
MREIVDLLPTAQVIASLILVGVIIVGERHKYNKKYLRQSKKFIVHESGNSEATCAMS